MRLQAARLGCQLQTGPYAWDLTKDSRIIRIGRRHFAHVAHLALDFDRLFETLVARRAGEGTLLDFSHIQMHLHRASGLKFELLQWPEPDPILDAYLRRYRPTADDLVFDLGAGCGISTFAFSNLAGRVIAYQPDAHLRAILERNIERLKMQNVVVAKQTATCLSDLIELYGCPALCKVNLDQVALDVFQQKAEAWMKLPIQFAAASKSAKCRMQFSQLMLDKGFKLHSDESFGVVWAESGIAAR